MENENGFHMGIWHQDTFAGVVSYNYVGREKRQTELGYWLGAQFQGKGLMTAACRTMTSYAFDTLHLKRVEIRCAVDNLKSRAIPIRLGFTEEDTVPQLEWLYDRYVDAVVYSMSAQDWFKLQQKTET
jgi:ribosomal-protein-serine acetyltransferase